MRFRSERETLANMHRLRSSPAQPNDRPPVTNKNIEVSDRILCMGICAQQWIPRGSRNMESGDRKDPWIMSGSKRPCRRVVLFCPRRGHHFHGLSRGEGRALRRGGSLLAFHAVHIFSIITCCAPSTRARSAPSTRKGKRARFAY